MGEQRLNWRKSSYSGTNGGGCVEVALTTRHAYVRDTKDRAGGTISVSREDWASFVERVKGSG